MSRLEAVIALIQQGGMRGVIWIDGSFLTEKLNPDDVDILLAITIDEYRSMDEKQKDFFDWFRANSLYEQYKCDNYGVLIGAQIAEAEYMYAYWLKQFGFSRGDQMKGLAVITVPFLVVP